MENKKILETAGQELEKRVSAVSNLQQTVEGVRSNLLDLLLEDENPKNREDLGNPIKEELEKKLQIAKAHKPPRVIYIANIEKVMGDLDSRIQGEKTDDTRKHLIDLNKKNTFNEAVLKQFVEEIFEVAKTTNKIENESIYTKLMSEPTYKEDTLRLLEHRKDEITDAKQKANIETIIKKLKKYIQKNKTEKENTLKNELLKEKKGDTDISGEKEVSDEQEISSEKEVSDEQEISGEKEISGEIDVSGETDDVDKQEETVATISNTIEVNRIIAERKAGEKLRERWNKTGGRNVFDKLNLFVRRKSIKDNIVNKELSYTDREKRKTLNRDQENQKAADRHEMEQEAGFSQKIENLVGSMMGIEKDYPQTYARIVNLADRFIGTAPDWKDNMTPAQFQTEFDYIMRNSGTGFDTARPGSATMTNWKPLNKLLKSSDMEQISTNILIKITGFKAHQKLVWNIADIIDKGESQVPPLSDIALDAKCRPLISKYITDYNKIPDFLKQLGIKFDDKNALKEIRNKQKNDRALLHIAKQTIKLKIQILNKGEEAYSVDEKLNTAAKIGRWIDDPVRNSKWFKKHPGFKKMFGRMRGVTKFGVMIAPGIAASAAGLPLAGAAGIVGGVAFTKTLFAKYSHYNKEHRLYLRKQAVEVLDTRAERERIANAVGGMKRYQGRFRGKKFKDRRQWNYYVKTSHDQLDLTEDLTSDITGLLERKEVLTTAQQNSLKQFVCEGLARLDHHQKTGQNFLGSQQPTVAEKEYQKLQRVVLAGAGRLGMDLTALRAEPNYDGTNNLINKGTGDTFETQGYEKARKRFKARQHTQALLGASKAGLIAFGISYAAGLITAKDAVTNTETTGTGTGHAEYNLGKYQQTGYASGNDLTPGLDGFLNNTTNVQSGGTLSLTVTSGTDATQVIAGHLTPAELASRHGSVIREIATNPTLAPSYKTQLLSRLSSNNPSTLAASNLGHTNPELASMRIYTGIQEIANSLSTSTNPAVTSGGLTLDINAIYSTPGSTVLTQADRFVDVGVEATKTVTTAGNPGYAVGLGFDNTFAQNNLKDQPKGNDKQPNKKTKNPLPVHGEKQGRSETDQTSESEQQPRGGTRRRPDLGEFRYQR